MKEFKGTKGEWSIGKHPSTVVSNMTVKNTNFPTPPNKEYSGREDIEYYGGYLICESIGNKEDAQLIATAPELLEVLQSIIKYWSTPQNNKLSLNDHVEHSLKLAKQAVDKALGK